MTARARNIPAEVVSPTVGHRNEVVLVGRLAVAPEVRALPSGDSLTSFRLVVGRSASSGRQPTHQTRSRPVTVDTLDCVTWQATVRRAAATWAPGDIVEVSGAIRRRFWRSPGGTASRCEVEVARARRLRRPAPTRRRAAGQARSEASG